MSIKNFISRILLMFILSLMLTSCVDKTPTEYGEPIRQKDFNGIWSNGICRFEVKLINEKYGFLYCDYTTSFDTLEIEIEGYGKILRLDGNNDSYRELHDDGRMFYQSENRVVEYKCIDSAKAVEEAIESKLRDAEWEKAKSKDVVIGDGEHETEARAFGKMEIKRSFNNPSTVDFDLFTSKTDHKGNNVYVHSGTLSAENAFGVRSKYAFEIRLKFSSSRDYKIINKVLNQIK
jgi:hypothetical protein